MPRLSKSAEEKQLDAVLGRIAIYEAEQKRAGWSAERTAASLGYKYVTLYKKKKKPENITLGELQRMAKAMNISIATLLGGGVSS